MKTGNFFATVLSGLVAVLLWCFVAGGLYAGFLTTRSGHVIARADDPTSFWLSVGAYAIVALILTLGTCLGIGKAMQQDK